MLVLDVRLEIRLLLAAERAVRASVLRHLAALVLDVHGERVLALVEPVARRTLKPWLLRAALKLDVAAQAGESRVASAAAFATELRTRGWRDACATFRPPPF